MSSLVLHLNCKFAGQKGFRYSLEERLFYIGLVKASASAGSIRRDYRIQDSQV